MNELDLNLLRIFDTLIEQRSVTRTANRLGLTQSAISHALARLRQSVGDPLFVRVSGGLQPTARAIEIAPGIRQGLLQFRDALSPSLFDPATAKRRFAISAGSYFCALLIPDVMARARAIAPGVSFRIVVPGSDLAAALDEGAVDLALGAFGKVPARTILEPLYREELVWIASVHNPVARPPVSLAQIATHPRLAIAVGKSFDGASAILSEGVLERRVVAGLGPDGSSSSEAGDPIAATVYDALTATAIVGRTDLVAQVPRFFALKNANRDSLVIIEPDDKDEGIDLAMLWHRKQGKDAGLTWLRGLIREAPASSTAAASAARVA